MLNKYKIFQSEEELNTTISVGDIYTLKINDLSIAVTQTKSGFFAFKDECPHNRVKLSNGKCNFIDEIVCPWHNYRFDLKTGMESSSHGLYLKTYPIEITNEGVYLTL